MNLDLIKKSMKKNSYLWLCFFLPFFTLWLVYIVRGVFPISDNSVLILDLNAQYVYYFEAFRDAFWEGKSLLYSWSRNLGGEMIGLVAYYLSSPFTFITLIFPEKFITEAILLMTLLKTGSCGLTFAIYLKSKDASKQHIIMFSYLYALCAYVVVQSMNTMWIDGVIFLPLIVWGTEKLINNGEFKLYTISLAVLFIANYYIGYMVGIFTFLYFLYYFFSKKNNTFKKFAYDFAKFLFFAIVAASIAAFIILPAFYSLKMGKIGFSNPSFEIKPKFDLLDIYVKMLAGSYDTVRPEGLPVIYSGLISFMLLPLYFVNPMIKLKDKILSASLLGVLLVSFNVSVIDLLWHGLQTPNWLNYRYSFTFSFVVILLAYEAFKKIKFLQRVHITTVYMILFVMILIIDKLDYEYIDTFFCTWFNIILSSIYVVFLLYTCKSYNTRKAMTVGLIVVIGAELFLNGVITMDDMDKDVVYSSRKSYRDVIDPAAETVQKIQEQDTSFYRTEKTFHRTVNDPMALGIYGISHSSSTLNAGVLKLLEEMGYSSRAHWARFTGNSVIADSLLGIKYIMTKEPKKYIDLDYEKMFSHGEIAVMKNPYALPIAFMGSEKTQSMVIDENNPFVTQNRMLSLMAGEEYVEFFKPIMIENTLFENVTVATAGDHTKYTPTVKGNNAHIEFYLKGAGENTIYFYFPSAYERKVNLWNGTDWIDTYFDNETYTVMSLGQYPTDEEIKFIMTVTEDEAFIKDTLFYYLDLELATQYLGKLQEEALEITKRTETYIEGKVLSTQSDGLLTTTIPYEEGWTVKIDGVKAEKIKYANALLAVKVPPGEHNITMNFIPSGFIEGIIISVVGVITLVVFAIFLPVRKRKHINVSISVEAPPPELSDDNKPNE